MSRSRIKLLALVGLLLAIPGVAWAASSAMAGCPCPCGPDCEDCPCC